MNWKLSLKRNLVKGAMVLPMVVGGIAHAQSSDPKKDAPPSDGIKETYAEQDPRFTTEAYIVSDFSVAPNAKGQSRDNLKIANSFVSFSAKLTDFIKAKITLQLDQALRQNGKNVDLDFDVGRFVEEAYIEIRLVENRPVALIIGKQQIAFGSNFTQMPANYNSPFYEVLRQREVFGFTLELHDVFGLDVAEFSLFETGENDLKIGSFDGGSIRLSKAIGENFYAQGSAMYKGNGGGKDETRADLGIVYMDEGGLTVWAEALYMKNNPIYKDNQFGITAGGSMPVGHGRVVAEVNWLIGSFTQLALGYKLKITKNLAVGTEVRYTFADGNSAVPEGFSFGMNFEVDLEKDIDPQYNNPIFAGSDSDQKAK